MRHEVLAASRIHERMEPCHDQRTGPPVCPAALIEDENTKRRLSSGIDRHPQLGFQLALDRVERGNDAVSDRRRRPPRPRSRRPVELAPWKRSPQPGRRPRTDLDEFLESTTDARRVDGAVAMQGDERIVARLPPSPALVHGNQDQIRTPQGQPLPSHCVTTRCAAGRCNGPVRGGRRDAPRRDPRQASKTRTPPR